MTLYLITIDYFRAKSYFWQVTSWVIHIWYLRFNNYETREQTISPSCNHHVSPVLKGWHLMNYLILIYSFIESCILIVYFLYTCELDFECFLVEEKHLCKFEKAWTKLLRHWRAWQPKHQFYDNQNGKLLSVCKWMTLAMEWGLYWHKLKAIQTILSIMQAKYLLRLTQTIVQ